MRFDYESLLADYDLVCDAVRHLAHTHFPRASPKEIQDRKQTLLAELKRDASFKLLTKFEADAREDFRYALHANHSEGLSIPYRSLFGARWGRLKARGGSRDAAIRSIEIEDILIELRDHFSRRDTDVSVQCSVLKGYFKTFRNWIAHGRIGPPFPTPEPDVLMQLGVRFRDDVFHQPPASVNRRPPGAST
ncbi:MAG: hypothetical protein HY423_12420 [Candidatus Lambdaproteobacteria bacterium]|nr:hypothetical protein [Candidatus Lambdaproteobacteria bacterium]